jgi:hypothetical protein
VRASSSVASIVAAAIAVATLLPHCAPPSICVRISDCDDGEACVDGACRRGPALDAGEPGAASRAPSSSDARGSAEEGASSPDGGPAADAADAADGATEPDAADAGADASADGPDDGGATEP